LDICTEFNLAFCLSMIAAVLVSYSTINGFKIMECYFINKNPLNNYLSIYYFFIYIVQFKHSNSIVQFNNPAVLTFQLNSATCWHSNLILQLNSLTVLIFKLNSPMQLTVYFGILKCHSTCTLSVRLLHWNTYQNSWTWIIDLCSYAYGTFVHSGQYSIATKMIYLSCS